ncbi:UNVERIFIED_ORG: hypothetical protein M2193_001768 [Bradyrhizobium japonicum]|jgi:hypothetical protein
MRLKTLEDENTRLKRLLAVNPRSNIAGRTTPPFDGRMNVAFPIASEIHALAVLQGQPSLPDDVRAERS